jgi:hypothetical protein
VNGLLCRPRVGHEAATFVQVEVQPSPVSLQDYQGYAQASSLRSLAAWTPVHAAPDIPLLVTCVAPSRPISLRLCTEIEHRGPLAGRSNRDGSSSVGG